MYWSIALTFTIREMVFYYSDHLQHKGIDRLYVMLIFEVRTLSMYNAIVGTLV